MAGSLKLTRFERARMVGARALQISMGAPTFGDVTKDLSNPIDIALAELKAGLLPMTIRRTMPDGKYEDFPVQRLLKGTEE